VDLWSNFVDWCGLKSYDPHTSVDQTRHGNSSASHPRSSSTPLLPPSSTWTAKMLSGPSTIIIKAASDATVEARVIVICVCCVVQCCSVSDWPSVWGLSGGINQMIVFQIIIAILHCLSDCMLAYYACSCKCFCELGLCLASIAHVRRAFMHSIVRSLRRNSCKVADSAINIAILPNQYESYSSLNLDSVYDLGSSADWSPFLAGHGLNLGQKGFVLKTQTKNWSSVSKSLASLICSLSNSVFYC